MAKISKEELEKFVALGQTDEEIGERYGISRQAIHQLRKKYGIESRLVENLARNAKISDLYKMGISGTAIAEKLGMSVSQTYRIIKTDGLEKESENNKEESVKISSEQERIVKAIMEVTSKSFDKVVGACIEGFGTTLLSLTREGQSISEPSSEPSSEPVVIQPKKAWVVIDEKRYESDTFKGLMIEVAKGLGPRRIYESYPEHTRQFMFNRRPEDKKEEYGDWFNEGRYHYWLYTHVSGEAVFSFIENAVTGLGLKITDRSK